LSCTLHALPLALRLNRKGTHSQNIVALRLTRLIAWRVAFVFGSFVTLAYLCEKWC
jgi:hypothetical protein